MPWCPKCKAEYQEGFKVCSDCDVELVDQLEEEKVFMPFFQSEEKSVSEKLMKYFEYSGLNSQVEFDEENEVYVLFVPEKQHKQAKKLYQAFYFVERERLEREALEKSASPADRDKDETSKDTKNPYDTEQNEGLLSEEGEEKPNVSYSSDPDGSVSDGVDSDDTEINSDISDQEPIDELQYSSSTQATDIEEDEADDNPYESATYVMKADQFKDYNATVWVFLLAGIAGLIVVFLNIAGVLNLFSGLLPNTVMGALFVVFIYIGLSSNKKAKQIQAEIEDENKLTENINKWLKENVTDEFLASNQNDTISKELNYIKTTEIIRNKLIENFGKQNPAYLDRLIEEFYSATFDEVSDVEI